MIIIETNKSYKGPIQEEDVIYFLNKHIQPVSNIHYGNEYAASITLKDGTFLPCVTFRHRAKIIDLMYTALHKQYQGNRTGDDKRPHDAEYVQKGVIDNYLTTENSIAFCDHFIKVEKCTFAMPGTILEKINKNAIPTNFFLAKFADGSYENFQTQNEGQFYEVPHNKNLEEIVEIFNSKLVLQNNEIIELKNLADWKNNESRLKHIHTSKPYFACYIGRQNQQDFAAYINETKERWG